MSGCYNTRSMAKGNEATRGNTSATPDNPGNSRIKEERGHKVCATSYNRMMTQILASLLLYCSMELGQNQVVLYHQNGQGVVV